MVKHCDEGVQEQDQESHTTHSWPGVEGLALLAWLLIGKQLRKKTNSPSEGRFIGINVLQRS